MNNVHEVTRAFEEKVADYTGAPFCVAVDSCCNAIFLALKWYHDRLMNYRAGVNVLEIPSHTYPGVPAEIIHAGFKVSFRDSPETLTGAYQFKPYPVYDSALRFTADMYMHTSHIPGNIMCLSFTGPYKRLKLGKGGAILTDSRPAYEWFKKARFSGRAECSYHEDDFDANPVIGWNFYMMPEVAARGFMLMTDFYNADGTKKQFPDLSLPYPDLSKFKLWQQ